MNLRIYFLIFASVMNVLYQPDELAQMYPWWTTEV